MSFVVFTLTMFVLAFNGIISIQIQFTSPFFDKKIKQKLKLNNYFAVLRYLQHVKLVLFATFIVNNYSRVVSDVSFLVEQVLLLRKHHRGHMEQNLHDPIVPKQSEISQGAVGLQSAGIELSRVHFLQVYQISETIYETFVPRRTIRVGQDRFLVVALISAKVDNSDFMHQIAGQKVEQAQ